MKKDGFTLLELLLTITIIAVISLIGYYTIVTYFQKARKEAFLTDTKTIYRESGTLYSTESLKGNKLSKISTDGEDARLSISRPELKYCIDLDTNGKVSHMKVTNGYYYIESKSLEEINSKNVKFGTFEDKFSCSYVLADTDIIEEKVLNVNISEKGLKIIKTVSTAFVVLVLLYLMFRSKNCR